jgi:hypothetical protein
LEVSVGPALTIRPWGSEDGDPANPEQVFGVPVQEILARRADRTAVLVALRGDRFALTGRVTAMGRSMALLHYVRVRARDTRHAADLLWLDDVYRLLGQRQPESPIRYSSAETSAPRTA